MNLSEGQAAFPRVGNSGAGGTLGGAAQAGPAHPHYQVGEIGFGPMWEEQPTLRELYDQAVAGLVRAECEMEELRAEVALLREEQTILKQQLRAAEALGLALVDRMKEDK
jgi:hypothetical protein